MLMTNRLNLPQPIVDAVKAHRYDGPTGQDERYSVTTLIGPPQIAQLVRQHENELVEDVSERIWALMGSAMHEILAKANTNAIVETRLETQIDGAIVSGAFDRMALLEDPHRKAFVLQDYKFASVWEVIYGTKPERIQQLNLYAWLATCNGYKVDAIENVMLLRDWKMREAKNNHEYPQQQVAVIPQPLAPLEDTEEFVVERIALHRRARAGETVECTDEDRWMKPEQFAVMKTGNKRATKVFNAHNEAFDWATTNMPAGKWEIETRRGEAVRCESYCPVADFCPQRQKEIRG